MRVLFKLFKQPGQPLLVTSILLLGTFLAFNLSQSESATPVAARESYTPAVKVLQSHATTYPIQVQGYGSIQAHTNINISPQVSGKIIYVHPDFRTGGLIKEGEVLLQIEKSDYQLRVTENEADVIAARTALSIENAEADTAQKGWKALKPNKTAPTLVSRQPQIAQAQARLKAAKAQLAQAQLNLERTSLTMPFDGRIISSNIGIGETVADGQIVGELYSNEKFEIPIALSIDELAWLELADKQNGTDGSKTVIEFSVGQESFQLPGKLTHISSELNERSRLAQIIISLHSEDIPEHLKHSVIPGLFVKASMTGKSLPQLHQLPKSTLRENNLLWSVVDNQLKLLEPSIVNQSGNTVLLGDLGDDIHIITSHLDVVTEGMQVRILD